MVEVFAAGVAVGIILTVLVISIITEILGAN